MKGFNKVLLCLGILLYVFFGVSAYSYQQSSGLAQNPHAIAISPDLSSISYVPRLYLSGLVGSGVLGKSDVLAPIWQTGTSNLFVYAQGNYAIAKHSWEENTWLGSLGVGFRHIVGNSFLMGGYVLGSYSNSTSGHDIKIVNPGIEVLGNIWDFRVNGFIPVGDKRWVDQGWADKYGDYQYVKFEGHNQYDHWYQYYQETGWGGNAEAGVKLFDVYHTLVKGYLSGYYFDMQHNDNVRGVGARITINPNSYLQLSLHDTYDNYSHNVIMAGLRLSLYDLFNQHGSAILTNLNHRLFDPIENTESNLQYGNNVPITRSNNPEDVGRALERSNIWFFNDSGVVVAGAANAGAVNEDGTYEHPYTVFNQQKVDKINAEAPGAYLYFAPGTYQSINGIGPVSLYAGQSMWGRTADYTKSAAGDNRALFVGALQLNSNNTLDSLRLENSAVNTFASGVTMDRANNVLLNNVTVGTATTNSTSYKTGIKMENNSALTLSRSDVYGYSNGPGTTDFGIGIDVNNGGTITAINGSKVVGYSLNGSGAGIKVEDVPSINKAFMGDINGDKTASFTGKGGASGYGLYAYSSKDLSIGNISESTFVGTGKEKGYGLYAWTYSGDLLQIGDISDSSFTGAGKMGAGLAVDNSASVQKGLVLIGNITGSTFTSSTGITGYGLNAYSEKDISIGNISGSTFTGSNTTTGYGLYANSYYQDISIGKITGSTFTGNGKEKGYGLYAYSNNDLTIGNITGSAFTGTGTTNGYGLYAWSYSSDMLQIGNISDSSFTGTGAIGVGLLVDNSALSPIHNGLVSVGTVLNSKFSGGTNSLFLLGKIVQVAGTQYVEADEGLLTTYLHNNGNTLTKPLKIDID